MKLVFSFLLVFATLFGRAQQNVYFLKNNGKYVTAKDSADFIRVVTLPDSGSVLYNVIEFYKNGVKKTIGKSTKIDPPRYLGQVVRFFENGKRASLYQQSDKGTVGAAYEFYPNGTVYRILKYPDSVKTDNIFAENYLITANSDSLGNKLVVDGRGYYKGFDSKFKYIDEEGRVKNGLRDSIWNGTDKNLKVTFTETYKEGNLIAGAMIDSAGAKFTYAGTRMTSPKFNGGNRAFGNYLGKNIIYPDLERKNGIYGVVILQFVVEKDGRVTDVRVQKSVSPGLDKEASRVIKNSPLWIPGTRFGKPIRVTYAVPINFLLQDG
ncbi:TonB family protein [Mucilaginibacter sp.]|uniref:energy transducer TonB n=1 Tax=Mucilaginibacter sp. TaxID=1882438 RepID=UPI0032648AC4